MVDPLSSVRSSTYPGGGGGVDPLASPPSAIIPPPGVRGEGGAEQHPPHHQRSASAAAAAMVGEATSGTWDGSSYPTTPGGGSQTPGTPPWAPGGPLDGQVISLGNGLTTGTVGHVPPVGTGGVGGGAGEQLSASGATTPGDGGRMSTASSLFGRAHPIPQEVARMLLGGKEMAGTGGGLGGGGLREGADAEAPGGQGGEEGPGSSFPEQFQ